MPKRHVSAFCLDHATLWRHQNGGLQRINLDFVRTARRVQCTGHVLKTDPVTPPHKTAHRGAPLGPSNGAAIAALARHHRR